MASGTVKKERLTNDRIKYDVITKMKEGSYTSDNIFYGVLCVFLIGGYSILYSPFAWFALLVPASVFFAWYFNRSRIMKAVEKGEFVIDTDVMVREEQSDLRKEFSIYKPKWVSYLQFNIYGRWEITGRFYTNSELEMSSYHLCDVSMINDEFYIVLVKGKSNKVVMAYNKRFFEYEP